MSEEYEKDAYKAALYGRATEEQQRAIAAGVALRQSELASLRATIATLTAERDAALADKAKLREAVKNVCPGCRPMVRPRERRPR